MVEAYEVLRATQRSGSLERTSKRGESALLQLLLSVPREGWPRCRPIYAHTHNKPFVYI